MIRAGPAFAIGVIDVGSPKTDKLGWAILGPGGEPRLGKDLDVFVAEMAGLADRWPLIIGFEAPLFIPTRTAALQILTGRKGEGSRPWSAGAGASVTTAALGVVTYTLAGLRRRLNGATATTDFRNPPPVQASTVLRGLRHRPRQRCRPRRRRTDRCQGNAETAERRGRLSIRNR